jgi:hypothetical protein
MAVTAKQNIDIKNAGPLRAIPVASGETIYEGAFAAITGGYLADLDTANVNTADVVCLVADDSANVTGAAATTANGSISGSLEEGSAVAGDKTVRQVYTEGLVKVTGSGFAQTSVGKVCYLADNYAANITGNGAKLGTIVTYISATTVYVDMNKFYASNGMITALVPLTAATTTTGGDLINWTAGAAIYVYDIILDVTTPATGAATADFGYAATGTSDDKFIDGVDIGTAAIFTTAMKQLIAGTGNAAGTAKLTSAQYVTGTPSASAAGLVGTVQIIYIKA